MTRAALLILGKDLRQRVRDKSLFLLGIGVPLGLAAVFSVVFGSALGGDLDVTIGLVDEAENAATAPFVGAIVDSDDLGLSAVKLADRPSATTALTNGDVDAVLVLPSGAGFQTRAVPHVLAHGDNSISAEIATALGRSFSLTVAATGQALTLADGLDAGQVDTAELATAIAQAGSAYRVEDVTADTRQLDGTTYIAAGMAVLFLFFTVGFGVMGYIEERRDGTLFRLQAAPIPRASIAIGKSLTSLVLGWLTLTTLVIGTQLLLGASWGPVLGVAALVCTSVIAATGIVAAISAVAKRMEQAESLQAIVAIGLGMLGGAFFPLGDGTGVLGLLSRLTPHYWFLEGLADIQGDAPWTAALPAAGALLVFAVVAAAIAVPLARWQRA